MRSPLFFITIIIFYFSSSAFGQDQKLIDLLTKTNQLVRQHNDVNPHREFVALDDNEFDLSELQEADLNDGFTVNESRDSVNPMVILSSLSERIDQNIEKILAYPKCVRIRPRLLPQRNDRHAFRRSQILVSRLFRKQRRLL